MSLTLKRTLSLTNPLMHGADVTAVQHLLTAKGFSCTPDGVFGPETGGRCVEAKQRLKYAKSAQTATCGQPLVDALEAHAPFKPAPLPAKRAAFTAELLLFNKTRIPRHYAQVRPIEEEESDCSGSITLAAERSDCPDPNGLRFNGEGYTGTMLSHCLHIPASLLRPGDLAVFGPFPGHHVIACISLTNDEWFSMGHEGDPGIYTLAAQAARQPAPTTYLSFLP